VEGNLLVHEQDDNIATRTITTIREAALFFGLDYEAEWFADFHDPPQPVDPDRPLRIDLWSARVLGQWFEFGFGMLERLRSNATADDDASEPQLWPEHFDAAIEMGSEGRRASYGASPGDDDHDQPYLYVSAWEEIDRSDPYWNDESFNGSSLAYGGLLEADDPFSRGLGFLLAGHRALRGDA
jgi:hypothetical protein